MDANAYHHAINRNRTDLPDQGGNAIADSLRPDYEVMKGLFTTQWVPAVWEANGPNGRVWWKS